MCVFLCERERERELEQKREREWFGGVGGSENQIGIEEIATKSYEGRLRILI